MWDWHLEASERNVMLWVPACTGAYLRRRWSEEVSMEEAHLYFLERNTTLKTLFLFFEGGGLSTKFCECVLTLMSMCVCLWAC